MQSESIRTGFALIAGTGRNKGRKGLSRTGERFVLFGTIVKIVVKIKNSSKNKVKKVIDSNKGL